MRSARTRLSVQSLFRCVARKCNAEKASMLCGRVIPHLSRICHVMTIFSSLRMFYSAAKSKADWNHDERWVCGGRQVRYQMIQRRRGLCYHSPTPTLRSPNGLHQNCFGPAKISDRTSNGGPWPMSTEDSSQRSSQGAHPCCSTPGKIRRWVFHFAAATKKQIVPQAKPCTFLIGANSRAWHRLRRTPSL